MLVLCRNVAAVFLALVTASVIADQSGVPAPAPAPAITALERFAAHRHSRVVPIHESSRISAAGGWIEIKSVSVRNMTTHPQEIRGLQFIVNYAQERDVVYLSHELAVTFRNRLVELRDIASKYRPPLTPAGLGTADCAPGMALSLIHI